jgi:hypothetical protein
MKTTLIKMFFLGLLTIFLTLSELLFPSLVTDLFNQQIWFFRFYHLIWVIVIYYTIKGLTTDFKKEIGKEIPEKKELLERFVKINNKGAIKSIIIWIMVLLIIGILFYTKIITTIDLIIITVFFYFLDVFFMHVWCPFQKKVIKNKCCQTCRIRKWGYLMVFCPLVFIPSFWTYSILIISALILIRLEYAHKKYPERFYELFNPNLMCKNCNKTCWWLRNVRR